MAHQLIKQVTRHRIGIGAPVEVLTSRLQQIAGHLNVVVSKVGKQGLVIKVSKIKLVNVSKKSVSTYLENKEGIGLGKDAKLD